MSLLSVPIWLKPVRLARSPTQRPGLHALEQVNPNRLPKFVQESEAAMKYLHLLGMLDWSHFPDRPDQR